MMFPVLFEHHVAPLPKGGSTWLNSGSQSLGCDRISLVSQVHVCPWENMLMHHREVWGEKSSVILKTSMLPAPPKTPSCRPCETGVPQESFLLIGHKSSIVNCVFMNLFAGTSLCVKTSFYGSIFSPGCFFSSRFQVFSAHFVQTCLLETTPAVFATRWQQKIICV